MPSSVCQNHSTEQGLAWLEARAELISTQPSYLGFHLVCMWDHLPLYESVPLTYPKLRTLVKALSKLD